MYSRNGVVDNSILQYLEDTWKRSLNEVKRLQDYADRGEPIRIWYSEAPYSVRGFNNVCSILRACYSNVSAIKLPPYIQKADNGIQSYTSWGEIRAGEFYKFTSLEKALSSHEIESIASMWDTLKEEKSLLRAVVNGKLIGVPEDFYDHLIRKETPDGDFKMSHLIGKLMINHPLGIGDGWYAKRIQRMIENGELKIVRNDAEMYVLSKQ